MMPTLPLACAKELHLVWFASQVCVTRPIAGWSCPTSNRTTTPCTVCRAAPSTSSSSRPSTRRAAAAASPGSWRQTVSAGSSAELSSLICSPSSDLCPPFFSFRLSQASLTASNKQVDNRWGVVDFASAIAGFQNWLYPLTTDRETMNLSALQAFHF